MATAEVLLDVGDTLVSLVTAAVAGTTVPAPTVLLSSADEMATFAPQNPAVTVFLYHIAANAEMRNAQPDAGFARPPLPLELRYLITPWAKSAATVHLLCGHILQTLEENACLQRGDLLGSAWGPDDILQILLETLPVSEHHDIWEPADMPYKLSLAYVARVVRIDPRVPVGAGVVTSATFGGPL
jgi:hypothetical protein